VNVLGIDNVFLPVGDLEAAVEFYRDVVGLPLAHRFDAMRMALFRVGAETPGLGVGVVEDPDSGAAKVWFEVPDAREAAAELSEHGTDPISPPFSIPTGWAFEITDPWGNTIGFTDYAHRPELGRPATDQPAVADPVAGADPVARADEASAPAGATDPA
jgi:predicted enzyme related to lactoylglutathione lyase